MGVARVLSLLLLIYPSSFWTKAAENISLTRQQQQLALRRVGKSDSGDGRSFCGIEEKKGSEEERKNRETERIENVAVCLFFAISLSQLILRQSILVFRSN